MLGFTPTCPVCDCIVRIKAYSCCLEGPALQTWSQWDIVSTSGLTLALSTLALLLEGVRLHPGSSETKERGKTVDTADFGGRDVVLSYCLLRACRATLGNTFRMCSEPHFLICKMGSH